MLIRSDQLLNLEHLADFERSELHDVTERIVKRSDGKRTRVKGLGGDSRD